jgi:hypothetical protein
MTMLAALNAQLWLFHTRWRIPRGKNTQRSGIAMLTMMSMQIVNT